MKVVEPKARRRGRVLGVCLIILSVQAAAAQDKVPKRVIEEKPLGSIGRVDFSHRDSQKPAFWISPDGRHFAYAAEKGFVIDGQAKQYDIGVKPETFCFSPDSQRAAYVALVRRAESSGRSETLVIDGEQGAKLYSNLIAPVFSPDSRHVASIARLSPSTFEHVAVIDGREGEKVDASFSWELAFTGDSRRVVYGVELDKRYVMREESIDGSEALIERTHGPAMLRDNFFFGPAGQLGYVAMDAPEKFFVCYDGQEEKHRFKEIKTHNIVVSADGKHLAFLAQPETFREVAVVDGQQGKVYGGFQEGDIVEGSLVLSPDGRRASYAVKDSRKAFNVTDGRPGKVYRWVSMPVFSPDGKHAAHLAVADNKLFSVVNGKEGQGYDDRGMPVFSPDSKSAAFWAAAGNRRFIVHNGQKQKMYDDAGTPVFSPDGKRLVYLAQAGGKWLLVDTGKEQKPYDDIKGRLYFSNDGRRLATVVFDAGEQMVVVDGVEGNRYDLIITLGGAKVYFDSPDRLHYLATKGDKLYLVEETAGQ